MSFLTNRLILLIACQAKHVPTGHIPRSISVIARGEATRCALPGDQVTITGIFLPTPYAGFKQIRIGLMADTFIEAQVRLISWLKD